MNPSRRQKALALAVMLGVLAATVGCSQFRSHKRLNLGPFAEQMIAVAGDIQYGLAQEQPVYLRRYRNDPEVQAFEIRARKIRAVVRGTISYSIEIVTVGDSKMSDAERAQAMADYLDGLLRPVLVNPPPEFHMTVARLDTIITDVRGQKNLLDALGAAQPLIDEVAYASGELFDETKDDLDEMVDYLRERIDDDYLEILAADRALRDGQVKIVWGIGYLKMAREGSETAVDSLFAVSPSLRGLIKDPQHPSEAEMRAVEDRMIFMLQNLREVRDQLAPDIELYWDKQRELDRLSATYNAALRKATVAVIAWARAHARLAAGVLDPAKVDLLGIAKKAAGTASPVPLP